MTKRRGTLTFELALTQIAGLIGWAECAKIVGQAERTVRNWSDPDTTAAITLDASLALDVAFQAAGGDGAPIWQCYSTRLQADTIDALATSDEIARSAACAAKESGEAVAATIAASRPGATRADHLIAERELEESIAAQSGALATIRRCLTGAASSTDADPERAQ